MQLELRVARWSVRVLGPIRTLCLNAQPLLELEQGNGTMRQGILLCFVHLGIRLAVVLEDRIPACNIQSQLVKNGHISQGLRTKIGRTASGYYHALCTFQ